VSLESVRLNQLGRAKRIEVTKVGCWITGGAGDDQSIQARAAGIRQQIAIEKSDFEIGKLQERLAKLVGQVCAIHVGGASSLERAERMYKMKSALHSAREAVGSGVLPGGGTALFRASRKLNDVSEASSMVASALEIPLRQQIANARQSERDILARIEGADSDSIGFDAESRQVVDLLEAGIVDPTRTSVSAVQLAFAHARAILQTGVWDLTARTASRTSSD